MKSPKNAFAGFDLDTQQFVIATYLMSSEEVGQLFYKLRDALRDGDVGFLRQQRFVGRIYRPRAKRAGINASTRRRIFDRDGHACRHCGVAERLEIDHIVPVVWGGGDEDSNLQCLCRRCNKAKGPQAHSFGKGPVS